MRLSRDARRHEAGVNPQDYWDFAPGQRVLTAEGVLGTVTAVEDGPFPGAEHYLVELDNGLGGGEYGPGELRPAEGTRRSAAVVDDESTFHTAADDYPELADILEERLPLPHSERIASKTASRPAGSIDCWFCDGTGDLLVEGGGAEECQACDGSGYLSPAEVRDIRGEASKEVVAGFWDRVLEPVADRMLKAQEESGYGTYDAETGAMASIDWCRFRKNRRCFYPKQLNEAATAQAGYAVWVPEDRGFCPRDPWDDQKACPVSEPGPNSGEPNYRLDATVPWEQGGQRMGVTAVEVDQSVEEMSKPKKPKQRTQGDELVEDLAEMVDTHRKQKANPYSTGNPYSATLRDGEFTFHFTAAWRDVQAKAKRIRQDGHIRVISASPTYFVGEVRGDTNIYQTTLMREPGTKRIAMWECGCAWAAYSWGRSGRWKKYEGRLCSHALALNYEGQSRGWVDEAEDREAPQWRSDPSITVKVPGDYKRPEHGEWRVGSLDEMEFGKVASTDPSLSEAPALVVARDMLADGDDPNEVIATLVALGVSDAPGLVSTAMSAKPFVVQVRGRVAPVLNLLPDGVEVAGIGKVPASECLYPSYHPTRGLTLSDRRASKTAASNTGCMVAIEVPRHISQALYEQVFDLWGGDVEPVTEYHVTLAYPGSADEVETDDLKAAVQDWALRWGPMEGRLSGYGVFHQAGGDKVLYASIDLPGLERARDDLVDTLARFGIALPDDHGFTPHLTLGYFGEANTPTPPQEMPEAAQEEFTINEVAVVIADDWMHTPLGPPEHLVQAREEFTDGVMERLDALGTKDPRFEGVTVDEDDDGFYVRTHRARSDSYPSPEAIPQSDVDFIESTGSLHEAGVVEDATSLLEAAYEAGDPDVPHAVRWYAPTPEGQGWAQHDSRREAMTSLPPHEFVGMPPSYQVCDVCDMVERHPVHHIVHQHPELLQVAADLKDEPEPALPETTGDEEDAEGAAADFVGDETDVADDPSIGAPAAVVDEDPSEQGEVIEPGDPRLAWLMSGSSPKQSEGDKEMNIAAAAKAHLAKTALKEFTPAEQKQIIEEGSAEGVVARNLDDLDLTDTHYAALEEALQEVEQVGDDTNWLL